MEHRDFEAEQLLGDIIAEGGDIDIYLNDTDDLQGEGEAGYGDPAMEEEEEHCDVGSGEGTESGQVYILIKPVLIDALIV
jgi:hypothetical protein